MAVIARQRKTKAVRSSSLGLGQAHLYLDSIPLELEVGAQPLADEALSHR